MKVVLFVVLSFVLCCLGLQTRLVLPSPLYDDDPRSYCVGKLPQSQPFPLSGYSPYHVSFVTRHGDRAPVHLWHWSESSVEWNCGTSEVVQDTTEWATATGKYSFVPRVPGRDNPYSLHMWKGSCGVGQLTPTGHAQHTALGKAMRQLLVKDYKLLPDVLTSNDTIYARSTDVWRTKQSAMSQLDALYPSNKRASGLVIPFDVYSDAVETATLSDGCPKAKELVNEMQKDEVWQKYIASRKALLERLNRIAGRSWVRLYEFSDSLHGRTCHDLPLPCHDNECVTEQDVRDVHAGANFEFTYEYNNDDLVRLGFSTFLHEVRARWDEAIKTGKPRFALYSAHDFTITLLQRSFRLNPTFWPPYASNWLFELWQHPKDGFAIRCVLNGVTQSIPGCSLANGTVCSLNDFDNILAKNFTIKNYEKECFG